VHQAKHVRLHGLDPSVEKGIVRSLQGKIPLQNVVLDAKIILKWISKKLDVCGLDSSGSGLGLVKGCTEHSNELLGCNNDRNCQSR
jgi:hypothetical protein